MPNRPLVSCSVPTCPNKAVTRGRCAEHAKRYRKERLSSKERGFDARWAATSKEYLAYHPHCQATDEAAVRDHARFGDQATETHHLVDYNAGGTDDWSNLQALCKRCHSRITMARVQGRG